MKKLRDILYRSRIKEVRGSTDLDVTRIAFDSRQVEPGNVFVAVRGTTVDGHDYINKAISAGASAIVCEDFPQELDSEKTYVKVSSSAISLGYMASNFFDNPSEKLEVIGVTGTNGKTSVVTLLYQLFSDLGHKCGQLSTVENRINDKVFPSTHTTSDALSINYLMREMVSKGCKYCFMEVSSHALDQHRVAGICFSRAVFTNITHDHLDYHKTFNNYLAAKKKLFDMLCADSLAIVNKDDQHWASLIKNSPTRVRTFGLKSSSDYKGKIVENSMSGLHLEINGFELWTPLVGRFNASNLIAVFAVANTYDQDDVKVLTVLSKLRGARGRFQQVTSDDGVHGIVDYAHTPDALQNVLRTIDQVRSGNEKIITVIGCGGDRDREKRPRMAQIAARFSDRVVLTSDNPRSEDAVAIIDEMKSGLNPIEKSKTLELVNRAEAIKTAVMMSAPGDVILVAGKGHETYQDVRGKKIPFDDLKILQEIMNQTTS
jgi:UDP-N-acetylmuramoyl-L-alanyl-D-glutamate--2,6-diaminopimelate ligase